MRVMRRVVREGALGGLARGGLAACVIAASLGCHPGRVVARSGDAVLTDRRLERLFAQSGIGDAAGFGHDLVETWGTYQGLGRAAAARDSLTDSATMGAAIAPAIVGARLEAWLKRQSPVWLAAETTQYRVRYAKGELLSAHDVVFPGHRADSLKLAVARATRFRRGVTRATLQASAKKDSAQYEDTGVFEAGHRLAPELERGIRATPMGGISAVVSTPYGAHVLYRPTYDEVAGAIAKRERAATMRRGQQAYMAALDSAGHVRVADSAVRVVRAAVRAPDAHGGDSTVVATSAVGPLTVGHVVWWLGVFPPAMAGRVARAPDSLVREFVINLVGYELMLRAADSAGVTPDSTAVANIRRMYRGSLVGAWHQLGVDSAKLGDGSVAGRTRRAGDRIDTYVDGLVKPKGRTQLVSVAPTVERAVRLKYGPAVDRVVMDSIVARMARVRAHEDSVRQAKMPKTAVPLPGGR